MDIPHFKRMFMEKTHYFAQLSEYNVIIYDKIRYICHKLISIIYI